MKNLKSYEEFLNESSDTQINEAYVPDNILAFAKKHGSDVVGLVKDVAGWVEKAGQKVTGGTAIGKNYSTIILDMKYQGGEISINLDNDTIELYGEEVTDAREFKKVFDKNRD